MTDEPRVCCMVSGEPHCAAPVVINERTGLRWPCDPNLRVKLTTFDRIAGTAVVSSYLPK